MPILTSLINAALSIVAAVTVGTATPPPTPANFQIFEDGAYKIANTQYHGCIVNQLCSNPTARVTREGVITAQHDGIVYTTYSPIYDATVGTVTAYTYTRTAYGTCKVYDHQTNTTSTLIGGPDTYCIYDVDMGARYTVTTEDDNGGMHSLTFVVIADGEEYNPLDYQ